VARERADGDVTGRLGSSSGDAPTPKSGQACIGAHHAGIADRMTIRRLVPADAAALQTLRLAALRESPASFSSSYEEECDTPLAVIEKHLAAGSQRTTFGAFEGSELVGMVGVGREHERKLIHKGFVRSMYVAPAHRGKGLGRQLLQRALSFASSMQGLRQVTLSVTAGNDAAVALYESAGFTVFGREPDALLVGDILHEEMHMVIRVDPGLS
jgi:ribosomal protein S18 acetylase RimI-like enzyme